MRNEENRPLAESTRALLREKVAEFDATHDLETDKRNAISGVIRACLEDQPVRTMLGDELRELQNLLRADLTVKAESLGVPASQSRVQAEGMPAFRALINAEACISHSDVSAARHAITILELALK